MTGTVGIYMLQGLVERCDGLDGEFVVHKLGAEAVLRGGFQQRVFAVKGGIGLFVSVDNDVLAGQRFY